MNRNAFCGYQSIPFHCLLPSGAELELGRETRERKGGGALSEVDGDVQFH